MDTPENTAFAELNLDLFEPPLTQSDGVSWQKCTNIAIPKVAQLPLVPRNGEKKRSRLAERIAENDVLVRQVKQLQEQNQKLADLQRTSAEVTKLFQKEKEQRIEQERCVKELKAGCAELEKKLDAEVLNCEKLQEQIKQNAMPVNRSDLVCSFIQLAQKVCEDHGASGLPRRDLYMLRKLRDYCKSAKINIPTPKSPIGKRKTSTTSVATQTEKVVTQSQATQHRFATATRGTMTLDAFRHPETLVAKPTCSIGTQSENFVKTNNQGTQHKNPTTTRSTTTTSFIKQHDVGTCFPEPEQANIRKILDEMLGWHKNITPLSPIRELEPEISTTSMKPIMNTVGTCTYLYDVHRELNFITAIPAQIKCSNSRPPSRSMFDDVKDESGSSYDDSDVTRELFSNLSCPQTCMNNVLGNHFDELWQIFGQMVLRLLQRRFNTTVPAAHTLNQVDFSNWLYSLYESSQIEAASKNTTKTVACESNEKKDYVANDTEQINICTMPIVETPPPMIGIDLQPIRLASKPKPKKRKVAFQSPIRAKRNTETRASLDTAITFLSTLQIFHEKNYNILDAELNAEELLLLSLTADDKNQAILKTADERNLKEFQSQTVQVPAVLNNNKVLQCGDSKIQSEAIIQSKTNAVEMQSSINSVSNHITDSDAQNKDCIDANAELELFGNDSDSEKIESPSKVSAPMELTSFACDMQVDSPDSLNLIIDEDDVEDVNNTVISTDDIAIESTRSNNRKRKTTILSSVDSQPESKRLTRFCTKQLGQLCMQEQPLSSAFNYYKSQEPESYSNINCDKVLVETILGPATENSLKAESKSTKCISLDESPASPIPETILENFETRLVEIPLEQPAYIRNKCEPKALLLYLLDASKQKNNKQERSNQATVPYKEQQLVIKITEFLNDPMFFESSCTKFVTQLFNITPDESEINNAIITSITKIKNNENVCLERLITTLRYFEFRRTNYIHRLMNTLEERLFRSKEKPKAELAHKYIKLHMHLIDLQSKLTNPVVYKNPARLVIMKILHQYKIDAPLLVLEVLNQYPTVLPHRENRSYNHDDPLITVIKHLLMSCKYDMQDPNGADRILLSKLRFEYHFQPFEPTKQQVLENLVEKLKSGKSQDLSLAFALFCRRSPMLKVIEEVLTPHLMPLANSYFDQSMHTEDNDANIVTLLTCISMIVKQLQLETDISIYVSLFKRFLLAGPRSCLQQAAAQAILRLQRFGFKYITDALSGYKPSYELTPMTRAMMLSFAAHRSQYKRSFIKSTRGIH